MDGFESFILPEILKQIPPNSRISELFAGGGAIGLNALIRTNAQSLHCSDNNGFGRTSFEKSLSQMNSSSLHAAEVGIISLLPCYCAV